MDLHHSNVANAASFEHLVVYLIQNITDQIRNLHVEFSCSRNSMCLAYTLLLT